MRLINLNLKMKRETNNEKRGEGRKVRQEFFSFFLFFFLPDQ